MCWIEPNKNQLATKSPKAKKSPAGKEPPVISLDADKSDNKDDKKVC
jgi:hypothetical protein